MFTSLTTGIMAVIARCVVLMFLLGFVSSQGFGSETVIVTDLSGTTHSGVLRTWTANSLSLESVTPHEFSRTDLKSVVIDRPNARVPLYEPAIWLTNGDRISARAVSVTEDSLTISWPLLGKLASVQIPLEQVMAIVLEWPADAEERLGFIADIETMPPGNDLAMLSNGDRSSGEFQGLDAAHVALKTGANVLKLDRSRVRAVRLNPELTVAKRPDERRAILRLTDGSRVTAKLVELNEDSLIIHTDALGKVSFPLGSMQVCHLFSERLIPLSDYESARVEFTPYLSTVWPLIRNANVRRGPLMLRGVPSETGLGMHSRMKVTYSLKGHERTLSGLVGIDDLTNGRGSATFAIDVDGRRAWTSQELTGTSPAAAISGVTLSGSKELSLIVEFGQLADVLDYADWCDLLIIADPSGQK